MDDSRINWRQLVATAFITGAVTVATGMVLFNLQTREPKLTFEAPATNPFRGTGQNFATYNVTIANRGAAPIDNVRAVIEVPSSHFEDYRITAPAALDYEHSLEGGGLVVLIPQLNPRESVITSVLATSEGTLPNSPQVSVRGSGLVGERIVTGQNASLFGARPWSFLITAMAAAYSGLLSLLVITRFAPFLSFFGFNIPFIHRHSGEQNEVLAYLCGKHGLIEDVQNYLSRSGRTSYWAEADRHAAIVEAGESCEKAESRKALLTDLLTYARIAYLSKSIIKFSIARISYAQGNYEEARSLLKGIQGNPVIKMRLQLHPHLRDLLTHN